MVVRLNRAYRYPQLPPAGYITSNYPTDYTAMEMEYMDREMQRMAIEELNRKYGPRRGTL